MKTPVYESSAAPCFNGRLAAASFCSKARIEATGMRDVESGSRVDLARRAE
ncbi:MAG: hypothetical protein WA185_18795 [Candidatus Acidiferrales bacterium]